jgi:hypothetical protein
VDLFFHYEKSDGFGRERTRDLGVPEASTQTPLEPPKPLGSNRQNSESPEPGQSLAPIQTLSLRTNFTFTRIHFPAFLHAKSSQLPCVNIQHYGCRS